ELARLLYINDVSDTIPILSGSDDWYEYFVYSDVIKNISSQNVRFMKKLLADINDQKQLIEDLKDDIEKLEQEKAELSAEKKKLEEDMAALEASKAELDSYAAQQKAYLSKLAAQNKELRDKVNALEYDVKASSKKMDELNNQLEELIRAEQAKNGDQPIYSTDGFIWPVSASYKRISTYFGYDAWRGGQHRGLDITGSGSSIAGAKIHAAQSGTVIAVYNGCKHNYGKNYSCGCGGGYGNYIIVDHGGGVSTMYAHTWGINVSTGQRVTQGDVLGNVGTTGWSTGYHLHFEVRVNGIAVNPLNYKYAYYY
ncbi:MAG: peptidoglycan DD-metalloendopeptidase family protein, partial [Oscillospiraceae bacterium]|nr:peptidoglycan DD-metalloendopeptidase family protein [Oscillospiraceae bacterium]